MSVLPRFPRTSSRKFLSTLAKGAVVLASSLGFLAAGTGSPASAATWTGSGYYGAVTPYTVAGVATYAGTGGFNPVPAIQAGRAYVGRSATTNGAQRIDIQTYLYVWANGRWQHIQSASQAYTIPVGRSAITSTGVTFTGTAGRFYGSYRVTMNVHWRDATTLRNLGGKAFDMNHGSDYGCQTFGNVRCSTSVGGYIDVW